MNATAAVIGGGIGGVAASIGLRDAGLTTHVFERAARFAEIGAAIGLSPNGVRALDALGHGIGAAVRAHGHPTPEHAVFPIRTAEGRVLAMRRPGESVRRFGTPWVAIRRVDLHQILLDAHGGDGLHTGHQLITLTADGDGVSARFGNGRIERTEVLVGADGLRSTVRAVLLGAEPPRHVASAVNGITPMAVLPEPLTEGFITLGEAEDWGRISMFCTRLGPREYYWGCAVRMHDGAAWPRDPNEARAALLDRLTGWASPVPEIVGAADDTGLLSRGIFDRPPAARWGTGPTTLLGDAAHPMNNSLGQGANAALEDAAVLGRRLAAADDPIAGLRAYERLRIPRTTRIVVQSADTSEQERRRPGDDGTDHFEDWLHGWSLDADDPTEPVPG